MPFERINLDQESLAKLSSGETFFNSLESVLNTLRDGREKFYALHYLELTHMFYSKAIEREYIENKFVAQMPSPKLSQVDPNLSPEAKIIAENVAGLENLKGALQDLTNHVATKGLNF